MKEQYVPYPIAIEMKALGFDEECYAYYDKDGEAYEFEYYDMDRTNSTLQSDYGGDKDCTAPLWQQALEWLDSKGIFIDIIYCKSGEFSAFVENECDISITDALLFKLYKSRSEAQEAAILEALKYMKNNKLQMNGKN